MSRIIYAECAKLEICIQERYESCNIFKEMALIAPDEESRRILLEISEDERAHAETFESVYSGFTGRKCTRKAGVVALARPYRDLLTDRIHQKRYSYGRYGDSYLDAPHPRFRDAYYRAHIGDNLHSLALLYLLTRL